MTDKTLDLFEQMPVTPDNVIYTIIFMACGSLANERSMSVGKTLFNQILDKISTHNCLWSSAIYMLIKFGDMKRAEQLFQSLKDKDISTYASMMKIYNLNKQPLKTLQLFQSIKQNLVPDATVFIACINACSQLGILTVCQSLVAQIPSHLQTDSTILNALIGMWVSVCHCTLSRSCFVFLIFFRVNPVQLKKLKRFSSRLTIPPLSPIIQ